MREAVARRLRRPVFVEPDAPEPADFTLTVTTREVPGRRWLAHIAEAEGDGRELGDRTVTLDAPSCAAGQEALAVLHDRATP